MLAHHATERDLLWPALLQELPAADAAAEERDLLPLVAAHLPPARWSAVTRAARPVLEEREQLLVLGPALEDACPDERARLLAGVGRGTRLVWRPAGRRRHRAAVVRLRGAPPAG